MICNFPKLFCHSKNIWMLTLITIIITYQLWIINYYYIIITKSHNSYCSVGVMELCLLNLLILIVSCVILTLVSSLRACQMFIRKILGKFTSFIFWRFETSLVSLGRFKNFKKVKSVNLSQISLLNMWLLVQTCESIPGPVKIKESCCHQGKGTAIT